MVHAAFYEAPSLASGPGGTGGITFDTGRNIAGVRKVKVWAFDADVKIRGIAVEFNDDTCISKYVMKSTDFRHCVNPLPEEFVVPPGEEIIKVLVWGGEAGVEAIQFVADGGTVSPRFGQAIASTPVEYSGKTDEGCLVGMYGASSVIYTARFQYHSFHRIGFSFHQIRYSRAVEVSEAPMDQASVEGEADY
jgi:hypothetical protein